MEPDSLRPPLRTATLEASADCRRPHLERSEALIVVDLTAIALGVAHSFSTSARRQDLDFTIDDGLAATADPGLVRVLLEHLLHQAVRHTAHEPLARIELRRALPQPPQPPGPPGAPGGPIHSSRLAVFVVRDNGRDPTVDHGLALASQIVERHGGRFRAVYGPTSGAELYFSLPRARSCRG